MTSVSDIVIPSHTDIKLTSSIGSTIISNFDVATPKDMLKVADKAMYDAKESGRARWVHREFNINDPE